MKHGKHKTDYVNPQIAKPSAEIDTVGDPALELRCSEYKSLRQELLENKKYIFERPLAIVAAVGIAAAQFKDNPHVAALPSFLIWILWVNLWFTVNRMHSTARIAAYINTAIEPKNPIPWIGWENALRRHRIWNRQHGPSKRQELIKAQMEAAPQPDSMRFYPMLLALHLVPVIFAVAASLLFVWDKHNATQSWMTRDALIGAFTGISALVFLGYVSFGSWRPSQMNRLIENQRATWLAVFHAEQRVGAQAKMCAAGGERNVELPNAIVENR